MGKHKEALKLAIKDELFGTFRAAKACAGDILPPQWLHNVYMPTLSPNEIMAFEEIVSEMIIEGIIEYAGGRKPSYRLTRKGAEMLC